MQHFHFRMDGREYTVNVNAEEEIVSIFDHAANIMLRTDPETCERERPNVWKAAYGLMDA
jgi:hypothetical protein